MTELKDSSDFKSAAWKAQQPAWQKTFDLWQSPLYVRTKREEYLERFRKEPQLKYEERLNRSVFTNEFKDTIETFAGMVFKADPSPKDNVPKPIEGLFTDIDGCGNSLHTFLIRAFEMFLRDGNCYIYIDSLPAPQAQDGKPLTNADRKDDRSFWVLYTASQLINHRYEKIGGREVLSLAVLEEKTIEPDGIYGEKEVIRHRVLRPGSYELLIKDAKNEFIPDPDNPGGPTGLTEIPLVSVKDIGVAPMLLTLAMLNEQYYNKVSDFDSWCHIANVPRQVLQFKSAEDAKKYKELNQNVEVGILLAGEGTNAFYLEPSGSGMEITERRCQEIKAQMSAIGVGLLAPTQVSAKSATEVLDTAGQRQSKLARYAREFENAVEKAFVFTAEQENVIRPNSVNMGEAEKSALKLTMDFDRLTFNAEQMGIFERMNASGKLSDLTFFELLENIFDFPADWSPEEEVKRKAEQRAGEPKPVVVNNPANVAQNATS